jgi:hypothetical protein
MHRFPHLCLIPLALVLAGCATPQSRIEKNPAMFAALSPEAQEDARNGIVKLGQTENMVFLAAGKPTYVQSRVDEQGATVVWRYTAYRYDSPPMRYGPWWRDPLYENRQEYDVLRVEFRDGKVVAIEHLKR